MRRQRDTLRSAKPKGGFTVFVFPFGSDLPDTLDKFRQRFGVIARSAIVTVIKAPAGPISRPMSTRPSVRHKFIDFSSQLWKFLSRKTLMFLAQLHKIITRKRIANDYLLSFNIFNGPTDYLFRNRAIFNCGYVAGCPTLLSRPLFPVPELWVPRSCAFCKGGHDARSYHRIVMPSGLHRTYGAHHLHFITCSCYRRLTLLGSGFYLFGEAGAVRMNEGWGKISFRDQVA